MRVLFATLATATALLLTACSGGTEGSTLQRSRSLESSRSPAATSPGGSGDSTAASTAATTPAPATPPAADTAPAASDAGTAPATTPATTPAPAPTSAAPGSCGNPKCLGGNGFGGCKATDSAGDVVTMGCQDGSCGCFAGGLSTAAFDGDVTSADDAAQLFLANCTCN
jgi:hypothetical protein